MTESSTTAGISHTLDHLARCADARIGALTVVLAGMVWAALCLWLASDGRAPSVTLVPIARERYYLAQAAFVVPLLLLQWGLCSGIAHGLARRLGGTGTLSTTAGCLGLALGGSLLLLFLVPDLIAYAAFGFSALAPVFRVTAPLVFLSSVAVGGALLARAHHIGAGRALLATFAGVLLQSLLAGPLLR